MVKIISIKKHLKEKFNNKRRAYDARIATNDLIFFKRYKIDIETTDLFRKFLGEKKTYIEFLEVLPKLEPKTLYYVVVHYYFAWHRCYRQLMSTIHVFPSLNITYKKFYSAKNYKKIFYYICYPRIKKSGDKVEQYKMFIDKVKLRVIK
jgi:hypothetical protein